METAPLVPLMTFPEVQLFKKYLTDARKYIEFGAGGSTVLATEFSNITELHTIESDASWLSIIAKNEMIQKALAEKRLFLHHADIGPVKGLGKPETLRYIHRWPNYFLGIWESLPSDADFILVDGRFRVACALFCLLMCKEPFVLAIHDYTNRPFYHVLEKYYVQMECEDKLAIFVPRQDMDVRLILQEAYHYFFLPQDTPETRLIKKMQKKDTAPRSKLFGA